MRANDVDLLRIERELWEKGYRLIAGVDEAGRGPLAGPVVAAAVIFEPEHIIPGVADSKSISRSERERLYQIIIHEAVAVGVSAGSARKIDREGIAPALYFAMARAVARLSISPDYVLIDGPHLIPSSILHGAFANPPPCLAVIRGDAISHSIAAASIIAKVTRDRLMQKLAQFYPVYGFERHKGYGTAEHMDLLMRHGPTPHHRYSFAPLRQSSLELSNNE